MQASQNRIATPASRFLALLGNMRLPTRTADGLGALVKMLAPHTQVRVLSHDPHPIVVQHPVHREWGRNWAKAIY